MGEPTQRAFATALTKAGTETYKEFLMPQQLAIGVSDAAGQLVHGFRASLEHSRDHILFVLDAKDAFQTVKRSVVLERMSKITGLEAQTTFWHTHATMRGRCSSWDPCATASSVTTTRAGTPRKGSCKAHLTRPLCIA